MVVRGIGAVGLRATEVLFESSSEGVLFSSAEGSVQAANRAAGTTLDRDPDEMTGLTLEGPDGLADQEDPRWSILAADAIAPARPSASSVCAEATGGSPISR